MQLEWVLCSWFSDGYRCKQVWTQHLWWACTSTCRRGRPSPSWTSSGTWWLNDDIDDEDWHQDWWRSQWQNGDVKDSGGKDEPDGLALLHSDLLLLPLAVGCDQGKEDHLWINNTSSVMLSPYLPVVKNHDVWPGQKLQEPPWPTSDQHAGPFSTGRSTLVSLNCYFSFQVQILLQSKQCLRSCCFRFQPLKTARNALLAVFNWDKMRSIPKDLSSPPTFLRDGN